MNVKEKTIKISIATVIAIYIAQAIGLQNPMSAGIVALLSVLDTRIDSIQTGFARLLSTLLAFAIATVVMSIFGFSVWAFGIYLIFYVPLAYRFGLEAGISPCSVLVTHFVVNQSLAMAWQLNGMALMGIGVLAAVLLNSWMPSHIGKLEALIIETETEMKTVLHLISERLLSEEFEITRIKRELSELNEQLKQMRELALIEYDNQVITKDDYYLQYTLMRLEQVNVLDRMTASLQNIELQTEQNNTLAGMFVQTAAEFEESNSGISLLEDLRQLYVHYRDDRLPQTRAEFESRAILYQILIDFERFLEIKHEFYLSNKAAK